jgi:hypothetical protein
VYSLGLNNTLGISFKLVKSRIKNIRRFKQGASRCKIAEAGFHSIAKLRGPFYRGIEFRTAGCSKCFISFGRFFHQSNICLENMAKKNNYDIGGLIRIQF